MNELEQLENFLIRKIEKLWNGIEVSGIDKDSSTPIVIKISVLREILEKVQDLKGQS